MKNNTVRKYGNPFGARIPEDKALCIAHVSDGDRFPIFYQCQKKRGRGPTKEYCGVHEPAAMKSREKKKKEKFLKRLDIELSVHKAWSYKVTLKRIAEAKCSHCSPIAKRAVS